MRKVFAEAAAAHEDLLPEDIGLGPYDGAIRAQIEERERRRRLLGSHATKGGGPERGLVGWWAFDESNDAPVTLDYSGNRHGAELDLATRAEGKEGNALVCNGGSASVPPFEALSMTSAVTVACWVKTAVAEQKNQWFVNRVLAGGTDSGFRLGVLGGRPCFQVPVTGFSHALTAATPLATNQWIHVAGTFDGETMRIYVDGIECGSLPRPGPIKPNQFPLCLGNYDRRHKAYFDGLLDEVKIYDRALSAEEFRRQIEAAAGR